VGPASSSPIAPIAGKKAPSRFRDGSLGEEALRKELTLQNAKCASGAAGAETIAQGASSPCRDRNAARARSLSVVLRIIVRPNQRKRATVSVD